jgi:hypothetical protein
LPDDFDVHNLPDSFIQDEVADNAQGDLQDSQDILEAVEVFID